MSMDLNFMLMGEDEILEEVDEYLLYCFYLGFQPEMRVRYKSPLRSPDNADDNASWSIFYNTSQSHKTYAWKDSGTGDFGDIFKLIMIILKCKNKAAAVEQVKKDFLFGKGAEIARQGIAPPKDVDPAHIKLKSRAFDHHDFQWWLERTGADEQRLQKFNVRRVQYYWMYDHQTTPSFPGDRVYSYRIGSSYQLYFPFRDRDRRFRNDFNENHLLGYNQLQYKSDTLIITKSMKDIVTLDTLGFEAVSPRGEHTPIPQKFLDDLWQRYKYIFTLFDNDGKHRAWYYQCPSIELPIVETKEKDPSDYYHSFGATYTCDIINSLIKNHPAMELAGSFDLYKKMNRLEIEQTLEKIYLTKVIRIQHVGRKVTNVCGLVQRIAVEFSGDKEGTCIIMINDTRYEFALPYFVQKAQIQTHGDTRPTTT